MVGEQIDRPPIQRRHDREVGVRHGKIGRDDEGAAPVARLKLVGESMEAFGAPRHQRQIIAAPGQLPR